jgi:hypothetical protein
VGPVHRFAATPGTLEPAGGIGQDGKTIIPALRGKEFFDYLEDDPRVRETL